MRCIEKFSLADAAVSVVVPVLNGARWLPEVLAAIRADLSGRSHEILVIDDGSRDRSVEICRQAGDASLVIVDGPRRGAAAAVNAGLQLARFDLVAQIDQDVIVRPGWFEALIDALRDPRVAAAQGWYCTDPAAPALARVMSIDLEQRYTRIDDGRSDHVCTGNVLWRLDALRHVGGLDETLGYGYDNDLSYRLIAAGYRLVIRRDAESVHRWREGVAGYLTQQYGFGYGRLDLVARHRNRLAGDAVSPPMMMAHPVLMAAALAALVGAGISGLVGRPAAPWALASAALGGLLVVERAIAGAVATRRFGDPAALLFPVVHLLRDLAWVAAMVRWLARRVAGAPLTPEHSMQPRTADRGAVAIARSGGTMSATGRFLVLVPAHNEAACLPAVVDEVRAIMPGVDLLVVDDGSVDDTPAVLAAYGVESLRLLQRGGLGTAVRVGLRRAASLGYGTVVRIDGDGQHDARDIAAIAGPVLRGEADVVIGTRYAGRRPGPGGALRRVAQRALAFALSNITGRPVTDATSGFCAFGPRALRLLSARHPGGYPEVELRLLLHRHGLTVCEVPIQQRPRLAGQTTLTPGRLVVAAARIALAIALTPLRGAVPGEHP